MDPATMMALFSMGQQVMNPEQDPAPQVTAQVPTSSFQGGNANPLNQTRGRQMMNGLGPLASPVMSSAELNAIEDSVEAPNRQVTDTTEAEQAGWGQKLGNAATSPEALSAMMQLALAPRSQPAPMVSPMNTTSSFQGGGMNPYQMLAQRRR